MSKRKRICLHCGNEFMPHACRPDQKYCSSGKCQRARRARWQRLKMKRDKDYRDNKRRCEQEWRQKNQGYWQAYRKKNPDYAERNRVRQRIRDARRRRSSSLKMLAKLDVFTRPHYSRKGGLFRIVPQGRGLLAKLDVLTVKLIPVERLRRM